MNTGDPGGSKTEARVAYTACALFALVGMGMCFASVKLRRQEDVVEARARVVEAEVIDFSTSARAAVPTLRFQLEDGRTVEAPAAAGVRPESLRLHSRVRARYDPNNPRVAWIEGSRSPLIALVLSGIGIGTVVASALAALLFRATARAARTEPAPAA